MTSATNSFLATPVPSSPGVTPGSSFNNAVHTDGDLVRAGLNYKFGAPVVAKYEARLCSSNAR